MGGKLASYDASGNIVAFFDTIDSPAPPDVSVIEITDAEWRSCLSACSCKVRDGALVAPSAPTAAQLLAERKEAKCSMLSAGCSSAIASGFASSALGPTYTYPSTLTDQSNQSTVAGCSSGGYLWCGTVGGWSLQLHTQAEAQAVLVDFIAWLNKCQRQLANLVAQVNAADTISDLQAITWQDPA